MQEWREQQISSGSYDQWNREPIEFEDGEFLGNSREEVDPFTGTRSTIVGARQIREPNFGLKLMLRCREDKLLLVVDDIYWAHSHEHVRMMQWVTPSTIGNPRELSGGFFVDLDEERSWGHQESIPASWLDREHAQSVTESDDESSAESFLAAILLEGEVTVRLRGSYNTSTATYTFGDITAAEHWQDIRACASEG